MFCRHLQIKLNKFGKMSPKNNKKPDNMTYLYTYFFKLYIIQLNAIYMPNYYKFGRDGRIWTDDHYTPSVVRYQAALHPESIYNDYI